MADEPVLLDLFCGGGGAGAGYARAGFAVVGVDIEDQPHYPFELVVMDALGVRPGRVRMEFDAVHASPPCQLFSQAALVRIRRNPAAAPPVNLIPQTRGLLRRIGLPYVIENVVRAPLEDPVRLCGSMFGLAVRRHRLFESSVDLRPVPKCDHKAQGRPVGVYHTMGDQVKGTDSRTGKIVYGGRTASTLEEGQGAMGIDWLPWRPLTQAVPPAYTEWIGGRLLAALGR